VPDAPWAALAREWSEAELLELLMVCGFYRFVAYAVNATRVAPEPWARPFPAANASTGEASAAEAEAGAAASGRP